MNLPSFGDDGLWNIKIRNESTCKFMQVVLEKIQENPDGGGLQFCSQIGRVIKIEGLTTNTFSNNRKFSFSFSTYL